MSQKSQFVEYIPALMLAGVSGDIYTEKGKAYQQVYMDDGIAMIQEEKEAIVLDVRRPAEFAEGHIPGAINIPSEEIGTDEIPRLP